MTTRKRPVSKQLVSLLAVSAMSIALVAVAAPAQAAVRCGGKRATIVGRNGNDANLRGTRRADVIAARGGIDTINGLGGSDIICAGPGGDFIFGGGGNDRILGQGGDDVMTGEAGGDSLVGGKGTLDIGFYGFATAPVTANLDTGVATGEGSDRLSGLEALFGSPLADRFTGDARANTIFGEDGNDTLIGGGGVDGLDGGLGDDDLDGGADLDLVFYNSGEQPVVADLSLNRVTGQGTDSLANFEVVVGSTSTSPDTFIGDDAPNYFLPEGGPDIVRGGGGFDMLMYFDSPQGVDVDLTQGRGGPGEAEGQTFESIEGVWGSPQADRLVGSGGNDLLLADAGNDVVDARAGDDMVSGGDGDDDLDGGQGTRDLIDYELAVAGVAVDLQAGEATGGEGTDSLANFEEVFGSFFDDTLGGNSGANNLWGWFGQDVLRGFGGNDTLVGGLVDGSSDGDADQLDGGDGTDQCGADVADTASLCEGPGIPPIHPLANDADAASRIRRNH
ncbi:MAG: calcium-binding protein [Actinomycetota bacterium]